MNDTKTYGLIVDDEEDILEIFKLSFEFEGIEVDTAINGQAALELIKLHPQKYSFIISDVVMPGIDGVLLLEAVKKEPENKDIPFLLLSGYSDYTRDAVIEKGAVDLLEKPVAFDHIFKIISTELSKS